MKIGLLINELPIYATKPLHADSGDSWLDQETPHAQANGIVTQYIT